ncbi:hypothetical protein H0R92_08020 [Treponema sp. OMZ 840]|uniref:anti-sigma factor family protein n=1 Tax=Treponema sp. OMZ 840 TaxID=244313 RepID=UPI003D91944A
MSTCPDKDIHCLYADNELQEPFKTEFEKHTDTCPHCRNILQTYSALREALAEDTQSHTLCEKDLDEGYVRLKARLSYKTVIMPARPFNAVSLSLKLLPAAAVFALALILPPYLFKTAATKAQSGSFYSAAAVRAEPIQKRGIVASETIRAASLASVLGTNYRPNIDVPELTAIDVFKPELSTVKTVNIQIPLSSVSQMPLIEPLNVQLTLYSDKDPFK